MIVTVEVLWPMNLRLFISYCHDMIPSAGYLFDDRDSGVLWPLNMRLFSSFCHIVIFSGGSSIDERDSEVL